MRTEQFVPLVYTCTKFLPLHKIFASYWNKVSGGRKTYVLSNNFEGHIEFDYDNFDYLNAAVDFDKDSRHFVTTMLYGLSQLSHKYVFLLLDDYIFLDVNWQKINSLVEYMDQHDIDFCSLASVGEQQLRPIDQERPDLGVTSDWVFTTTDTYEYRYSVQPGVWRVDALQTILKCDPELTLHKLDTAIFNSCIRELPIKHICTNKPSTPAASNFRKDDYVLHYIEIMRWGHLNHVDATYAIPFIKQLINEFNITFDETSIYKDLIFPGDTTYAG